MKKLFTILGIVIFTLSSWAQIQHTSFNFRNFNKSLALTINGLQSAKYYTDEYGKTIQSNNPTNILYRYLFHGQEYEEFLGIYFYPSRIYCATTKRFLQTDPKSQYFSPYSFVGCDPVNYIDETGKAGKALFLYAENHTKPGGTEAFVKDIQAQAKDVYAVSFSDFFNGKVMDLDEFNGNIFAASHGGADGSIITETARSEEELLTKGRLRDVFFEEEKNVYHNIVETHDLGKEIRKFADKRGLKVKNISSGACQGSKGAEEIGAGFAQQSQFIPPIARNSTLETHGIHGDYNIAYVGDHYATEHGFATPGETKLYPLPAEGRGWENVRYNADRGVSPPRLNGYYLGKDASGVDQMAAEASGEELAGFVQEARVPSFLGGLVKSYKFPY